MPVRTYAALFPYVLSGESRRSNGVLQVARASTAAVAEDFDRRIVLVARGMADVLGDAFGPEVEIVELDAPRLYLRRRDARRPFGAGKTMASAAAGVDRVLRTLRPNVLHLHASSTAPLIPVAQWRRVPVLLHIHERGENLPAGVYPLINGVVHWATAAVIVPAGFLLQWHPKAVLIPNPIPTDVVGRPAVDKTADPRVVFVGVIARRKGLHHIIEALPAVLSTVPRTRLDIVGAAHPEDLDGPRYRGEVERRADELGVCEAIAWQGAVHDPFPLMSRAWIGVIAGDRDIAPMVALETAAARTALVVASDGGIRDVLGPDDACWVSPGDVRGLADAIAQLLGDRERRELLAARGAAAAAATVPTFKSRLRDVVRGVAS